MSRQHATPVRIDAEGARPLSPVSLGSSAEQISEAALQNLIHNYPQVLPIREIDPLFADPVPLCMELHTNAGAIDNVMVTETGLPVLVECKLWRNPEGRREVVGQILDYAKELARWSASDLQREVARRVGGEGNPILRLLGAAGRHVDEITFNDALTFNLRRGRFLLLIVGDGIRESVETIAEYIQSHTGLHFSLGLVELPLFTLPDGSQLVAPRVLARTELIQRTVIAVPETHIVVDASSDEAAIGDDVVDPNSRINFWTDFVKGLTLDDPDQTKPRAGRQGYVTTTFPVPGGNCWLVVYRSEPKCRVGVYLSFSKESIGSLVNDRLLHDEVEIIAELSGSAKVELQRDGRRLIIDYITTGSWTDVMERERALAWLRSRTNDFVNVLRPRVKAAVADLSGVP